MLTSVQGIYRDGHIELIEQPGAMKDNTPVIVTFLAPNSNGISLSDRGIDQYRAEILRTALSSFTEEWDSPEMDIYDSFHKESQ